MRELLHDSDAAVAQEAEAEVAALQRRRRAAAHALVLSLLPAEEEPARGVVLEVRAGAGGAEAALFAQDLFRMYAAFAGAARRGVYTALAW